MRKYNRKTCTSVVRDRFMDKWGRIITVLGTHAFDYTIYIEGISTVSVERFTNGALARKRVYELKKKK